MPAVESLSHASGVPAPFGKGAFFVRYRYRAGQGSHNFRPARSALTAAARCLWLVPITHPDHPVVEVPAGNLRLPYSLKKEPPGWAALDYVGDLGITPGKP